MPLVVAGTGAGLVIVADTADHLGLWDFGIAVVGLSGLVSVRLVQRGDTWAATPYSEPDYRQTVRATHERLVKDPDSIVEDLTGRLNRALGDSAPSPSCNSAIGHLTVLAICGRTLSTYT